MIIKYVPDLLIPGGFGNPGGGFFFVAIDVGGSGGLDFFFFIAAAVAFGAGGGSTLVYDFAVALSDLLQSPNATVYPKDIPIGLKVKMPLGEVGVNVDTGASAVFDLSDDLRQLKVYEHYTTPPTSPLNVPSQLLHMYSNRIRELLNIYADDAGQYALLQQRELLNNYMAFKTQLIPSMGNKNVPKTKRYISDVSRQFEATNLNRYCVSVVEKEEDIKGMARPETYNYETITCGMPAAHSIGFKHGGLITLQEEYLRLRRKAVDGYITTPEENRLERLGR